MTEATTIRVLLAEDSFVVREGVRALIDAQDGLELVGTCDDLPELLAAVERGRPDVVLTDIRMPPTQTDEGVRAAQWLRREHPEIGVVVLSQYVEEGYAMRLFEDGSGGRAYLLKLRHEALRHIPSAAGRNSEGGSWIRWLTWIRKMKGTIACQKSNGRVQAYETVRCGIRVIRRKLYCL